ncbi:MAG TPA: aryl-sulfate sulfotransferase [Terriglobia bacterium]|nr:aryl-sulfate sulfotransferase [Terriglobia bacterium]
MNFRGSLWFVVLVSINAVLTFNCGQTSPTTSFVDPNNISLSISPTVSAVVTGNTLQFTAQAADSSCSAVAWSIVDPRPFKGAIDQNGLYTAPAAQLITPVMIKAACASSPANSTTATVWVMGKGTVSSTNNPLVAQYSITVPSGSNVKVEFGPDTSYGLDTWTQPSPTGGGTVIILVAGMRASTTYHMRADVDLPGDVPFQDIDHSFQTGAPPAGRIPQITVQTPGTMTPSPGVEQLTMANGSLTTNLLEAVVTDLQGNVIWYHDLDPSGTTKRSAFPFKLMSNGHVLVNVYNGIGLPNLLREIDLAGNTLREMGIPDLNTRLAAAGFNLVVNFIHHDFALLPNGHVILLGSHTKDFTDLPGYPGTTTVSADCLVDIDQNWNPVWVWDAFDHLDVNRHPRGLPDWTHGNAVIYSADDGNLLYSSRHQSWVIKIDYDDGRGNGNILWRFGYQGDFTLDSGAPAAWQYGQHDIQILSANTTGIFTLGLFDNGYIRVLDDTGTLCGTTGQPACYSRVPFFQVNEATKTAHVLWEDSNLPYSRAVGSIKLLPNGDVEFDEGFLPANPFESHVLEVTQETNPQTVWELDVTSGQVGYRIYRIPSLYPGVQW